MNSLLKDEIREVMNTLHYRPAISLILPFEPKMGLKHEIVHTLKVVADKVEKELQQQYPGELCVPAMRKLRSIIKGLNFNTHKKSVAIYVSPFFEKVLYLDITVEQKIIIDESFEIRDLVYSKKKAYRFLVLVLSSRAGKMYVANADELVQIVTHSPHTAEVYNRDMPQRVSNFSDVYDIKEAGLKKFLQHVDHSLGIILNAYHIPLFVLGTEKVIGYFKNLTHHANAVIEYIKGNYEHASMATLNEILLPYKKDWDRVLQKDIMNKLNEAADQKKLVCGINNVWKEATLRQPQLLVVEKDFMLVAQVDTAKDAVYSLAEPYDKFSCIKDAVDDVIEKVFTAGGDVEFVENGMLASYNRIALIRYW